MGAQGAIERGAYRAISNQPDGGRSGSNSICPPQIGRTRGGGDEEGGGSLPPTTMDYNAWCALVATRVALRLGT